MNLPYYSKGLGRWLFIRKQPGFTRRPKKPKVGRWILAALLVWAYFKLLGAV